MQQLFRALTALNPNAFNVIATVLDGPEAGSKCLMSDRQILWQQGNNALVQNLLEKNDIISGVVMDETLGRVFFEVLGNKKRLVICGGGHISIPLIQMGRMLGFEITVLEDRPQFAQNARQAGADLVICDAFTDGLQQIEGNDDTFFIIVTRGHQHDELCLKEIIRKPHAYIGMIGSRRRVTIVKQRLVEQEGCDTALLETVHTPIGLKIGAETPEEIAVAIMAEIIQVKSNSGRNATYPKELLRVLNDTTETAQSRAIATIVTRKGSAPRDVGARMVIYADGRLLGSIGGGCAQSEIIRHARMMMDTEETFRVQTVDLTADAAADEGMVCGGIIEVMIEIMKPEC